MRLQIDAFLVIKQHPDEDIPIVAYVDQYEAKFYAQSAEHETGIPHIVEPCVITEGE